MCKQQKLEKYCTNYIKSIKYGVTRSILNLINICSCMYELFLEME